ncbi:hypothetical protein BDB01DRAFT_173994 [Pilobolus umbonatus]|nr:hypothetical protein BDB01DRAFT_173994 [Pilobolus umbonatus]
MAEGKSDINLSLPFTLDNPSQSTHRASWSSSFIHNKSKPVEPSFEEFDLNAIASANNNDISITQPHIIQLKRPSSLRNYQNYTGNTIFFCHGRFLTSRSFWAFLLSLFLLIAPSILFLVFTCPWLWFHMSPSIPIVFSYLFLLTIAAMLKTSWTDPGVNITS